MARPNFLFFENVSNLINDTRAFEQICFTLSKIGFDIEWSALRASDVGANHQRNRLFIFGYRKEALKFINPKLPDSYGERRDQLDYATESVKEKRQPHKSNNQTGKYGNVSNPNSVGPGKNVNRLTSSKVMPNATKGYAKPDWWENEPRIRRVVDGVAFGAYRIRACGNGVVPLQAALAYYHLIQRAKKINGVA